MPVPRVNGGINLHPLRRYDRVSDFTAPVIVAQLVDLQLRAVYELGFDAARITLSFSYFAPDFYASIAYVRALRALGIDVLGIIGEFGPGFGIARALADERIRPLVLRAYRDIFARPVEPVSGIDRPGALAFQVLNEPANFFGLPPADYVRHALAPASRELRRIAPELPLVSAPPVGGSDGVLRLRAMIDAGMERHCDRLAVNVYETAVLPFLAPMPRLPVWVTETGIRGPDEHLAWYRESVAEIRAGLPDVERVFYYDLFDFERHGYRIIDILELNDGFESRVESPSLVEHLQRRIVDEAGPGPYVPYDDLVPDVSAYFPDDEDARIIASTSEAADLPPPIPGG
jgi:hypothetical protein